ncbi:MAG: hypothetical protein KAJ35_08110, partial [Thermoplasmata archaeon]|nr:hypothetical protein [Thermoplasmata archaeon]
MVASSTLPALAGTTEEFTDASTEVALLLDPGTADNTSRIKFPTDSRVRDVSVTLRSNQDLMYTQVLADGGNVSAWSDTPDEVDLSVLDVDSFMGTPFSAADLTKVALNSTTSVKTTVSSNASTHLFSFNTSAVMEDTARDVSMVMDWTGMGTRMGPVAVDMVNLYVADFSRDRWHMWDEFDRVPSTGEQIAFTATMGPYSGWTDDTGMMYVLAAVESFGPDTGSSLTTAHMLLQIWTSQAPADLTVDVGEDGVPEFAWNGNGVGLYGLQNVLEDGSTDVTADFTAGNEHINLTSFLVPVGADLVEAKVGLAGIPGDTITSSLPELAYINAHGMTSDTSIEGIPDYADPNWAQVVLTDLKNAGMKDQSQEVAIGAQPVGNFGLGDTSVSQTFTPSINGNLVFINISILGDVFDSPPDIVIEIRTTDGNGHP